MSTVHPEPRPVADKVDAFIRHERATAQTATNRTPLDASGAYDLHRLAADVHAMGWTDGHVTGYSQGYAAAEHDVKARIDALETRLTDLLATVSQDAPDGR